MSKYQTGDLRERLTLETPNSTQDDNGQPVESWLPTAVLWGMVEPIQATEGLRDEQTSAVITHRVVVRHRTDLTTEKRFVWESRNLNIVKHFDPEQRGAWTVCECKEAVT